MKILSVKGVEVLLDDEDYERLKGFKYNPIYRRLGRNIGVVDRIQRNAPSRIGQVSIAISWDILGVPPRGVYIDHIDRDAKNNQRSNLRYASRMQNTANRNGWSKHGCKGVSHTPCHNRKKHWHAYITVNRKHKSLGYYLTKEEASAAYQAASIALFGEFAFT